MDPPADTVSCLEDRDLHAALGEERGDRRAGESCAHHGDAFARGRRDHDFFGGAGARGDGSAHRAGSVDVGRLAGEEQPLADGPRQGGAGIGQHTDRGEADGAERVRVRCPGAAHAAACGGDTGRRLRLTRAGGGGRGRRFGGTGDEQHRSDTGSGAEEQSAARDPHRDATLSRLIGFRLPTPRRVRQAARGQLLKNSAPRAGEPAGPRGSGRF